MVRNNAEEEERSKGDKVDIVDQSGFFKGGYQQSGIEGGGKGVGGGGGRILCIVNCFMFGCW